MAKYEQTGNSLELLAAVSMERAASRTQQKLFPMQQCVNDAYIDEVSSVHPCQSSDMPRTVKETEPVNSQTQQNVGEFTLKFCFTSLIINTLDQQFSTFLPLCNPY